MTLPRPIPGLLPGDGPLLDRFGRRHTYLRVSVTDRCDLRCVYCVPDGGFALKDKATLLTFEEIARVVRVFVGLGIRRVRLTGGEPLLRRDLPELVRALAALGLDDLALTTNGTRLADLARPLADAGLRRVNVSLDAVDPEVFRRMSRGGDVARVLRGIDAAREAGLVPIKVNAVIVVGENDGEIEALVRHFADRPDVVLRFLETMPFEHDATRRHLSSAEVRERLARRRGLTPLGPGDGGPAVDWRLDDTGQRVGFVSPITEHFCERCNRLRLEADGHLRTCLSREAAPSLRDLLRAGATDDELVATIRARVWDKVAGHEAHLDDGWRRFEGVMTRIGG